ncbi:stage II sporulation protein E [Pseudalkalibacillus caeni]
MLKKEGGGMQGEMIVQQSQQSAMKFLQNVRTKVESLFIDKGLLLFIVGFLLGRAVILSDLSPFALPFFGAVFCLRKERAGIVMLALLAGALTNILLNSGFMLIGMVLFLFTAKLLNRRNLLTIKWLPFTVFAISIAARVILTYLSQGTLQNTNWILAGVEAGLSFVLTMIFIQSMPLLTLKKIKHSLKNEEIISFIILLASVMTGTIGWFLYGFSVENILSRYLVLIFSYVGGAAIGSAVGVVTGIILSLANIASLYQMSMLAFSGLLGGLLKEGRKVGVASGLLIGTLLIGLYGGGAETIYVTLIESILAIGFFLLTPKSAFAKLARYIPGTREYSQEQQQYLRRVRDVTANRVEQFSSLFQALSNSFSNNNFHHQDESAEREVDIFLSHITEKTCQTCFKKENCWAQNFDTTYEHMKGIMTELEDGTEIHNRILKKEFDKHCVKSKKVIELISQEMSHFQANRKLKKQVKESRKIVAEQLLGVSQVMGNFAKEIQKERDNLQHQEDQVMDAIKGIGLEVSGIDIYSLEEGSVDIEMALPYCQGRGEGEKIIAPMLSDILNETITVKKEVCAEHPDGVCRLYFTSAKDFIVETGMANAAKGGAWVSGDSHSTIELGSGKYAIAISDGMGNGERAHLESNETIQLLQKILQSGIDETVAIKSVNSVLSLRNTDEIFSTLDLAMIDLQDANAKFLKIGSTPSFIKRGEKVHMVEAGNLPMGIIQEFDVDVVSEQLKAGDLLIMMSDGVFDGVKNVENPEFWMKRKIRELQTVEPQAVADLIMEEVIRTDEGLIKDDMTVVVAKIKRNIPKWSTIPIYSAPSFKRKKAL